MTDEKEREKETRRKEHERRVVEAYFKSTPKLLEDTAIKIENLGKEMGESKSFFSSIWKDPIVRIANDFQKICKDLRDNLDNHDESEKGLTSWSKQDIEKLTIAIVSVRFSANQYKSNLNKIMTGDGGTLYEQLNKILDRYSKITSENNKALNNLDHSMLVSKFYS